MGSPLPQAATQIQEAFQLPSSEHDESSWARAGPARSLELTRQRRGAEAEGRATAAAERVGQGPRAALERRRQEGALGSINTDGPGLEGARLSTWQRTGVLGGPQTGTGGCVIRPGAASRTSQ